jgi:allophanate hydrolase subunit 2
MADRQSTGGYPKIGTVIRADLPLLAQSRPGSSVRFQSVTVDAAVRALKASRIHVALPTQEMRARPVVDIALLASGNFASGVASAIDERFG